MNVGQKNPAIETPIEVQPSACPRLATNHCDTAIETTRNPATDAEVTRNTPRTSTYCQYSSIWLMKNSAGMQITAAANMIGRAPKRSIRGPSARPITINSACPIESAAKNCVRDQPNSSMNSGANTATTEV